MDRGALYIAYGERAKAQARASINTLHKHAPDLPVTVVSDRPMPDGVQTIIRPDADLGARTYKTSMYVLSPYQQTLFLDADTEVRASPRAGFNLLGYVDMVLAQDVNRVFAYNKWPHLRPEEVRETVALLGTAHHMYFNSGVIFFNKNERVEEVMHMWHEEWRRFGNQDQMALLRAIHACPVRIAPMRHPWNSHRTHEASFVFHKHRQARRDGAPK